MVRAPARFLADLTAELSGSIGLGSSLNAEADCAMAQAAHGRRLSLILSASRLLAWHGRQRAQPAFTKAAAAIDEAAAAAIGPRDHARYWW